MPQPRLKRFLLQLPRTGACCILDIASNIQTQSTWVEGYGAQGIQFALMHMQYRKSASYVSCLIEECFHVDHRDYRAKISLYSPKRSHILAFRQIYYWPSPSNTTISDHTQCIQPSTSKSTEASCEPTLQVVAVFPKRALTIQLPLQ